MRREVSFRWGPNYLTEWGGKIVAEMVLVMSPRRMSLVTRVSCPAACLSNPVRGLPLAISQTPLSLLIACSAECVVRQNVSGLLSQAGFFCLELVIGKRR